MLLIYSDNTSLIAQFKHKTQKICKTSGKVTDNKQGNNQITRSQVQVTRRRLSGLHHKGFTCSLRHCGIEWKSQGERKLDVTEPISRHVSGNVAWISSHRTKVSSRKAKGSSGKAKVRWTRPYRMVVVSPQLSHKMEVARRRPDGQDHIGCTSCLRHCSIGFES